MLDELGFEEKEIEAFFQNAPYGGDLIAYIANSPISASKLKRALTIIRKEMINEITPLLSNFLSNQQALANQNFINQLAESNDDAFFILVGTFRDRIIENINPQNDNFNQINLQLNVERIVGYFNSEIQQYLCCACACLLSGLPKPAIANLEMVFIKLIETLNLHEAADEMLLLEGEKIKASKISKNANKKRHAKTNMIKAFAIKRYEESTFPSVRNASQRLAKEVMDYAENNPDLKKMEGTDKKFTCPFQTADTIERWIGKHKRLQTEKS